MCSIPPPPPPAPPSMPEPTSDTKSLTRPSLRFPAFTFDPNACRWAAEIPDLMEACAKYRVCLYDVPFTYKYQEFKPMIQVGPTCGLVTLSMLLKEEVTANELLNMSRIEGFSTNGEMLSSKNMMRLAEKVLSLKKMDNVRVELKKGDIFSSYVIESLLAGAVMLVPYDADFNHTPCLKNGHTAHWALVCGIIIVDDPKDDYTSDADNIYVVCRQGKSRYLAVWNLYKLDISNKNLWEFSPQKETDGVSYTIPDGGIGGENGLRNQFLIFNI